MLCEMCKVNEATVHILEDVNGTKKEVHLCLSCAEKKAFGHAVLGGMDLSGVLESLEKNLGESGLSLFKRDASDETETPLPSITCPVCSRTSEQLRKTGLTGCPECYVTFSDELTDRCLNLHKSAVHTGRIHVSNAENSELEQAAGEIEREKKIRFLLDELEQDLQQSIRREEYELAAQIRDRIAALKQRTGEDR